jgi:hypothetical protein
MSLWPWTSIRLVLYLCTGGIGIATYASNRSLLAGRIVRDELHMCDALDLTDDVDEEYDYVSSALSECG